ncbi:ABC transporter permease [Hymenobacter sp. AT01-02]|uniref:ABC transporter permease n=1 Tax=Hymenobacter sp. AT01-02 TaxID=1571877 RepID=UPI0005F24977
MTRRLSFAQWLAVSWLLLVVVSACIAPTSSPVPDLLHTQEPPFQDPHWLGTDPLGHDVLQLLLAGARTTLLISIPTAVLASLLGGAAGSIAGFWGNSTYQVQRASAAAGVIGAVIALLFIPQLRTNPFPVGLVIGVLSCTVYYALRRTSWGQRQIAVPIDSMVQALIALLDSIPLLSLVLAIAAVQRPSSMGLVVLLVLTCWTTPARLLRAVTLRTKALLFVEAAVVAGLPTLRILRYHIWPNTWPVLLIRLPLSIAIIIGLETTLSFLGIGLAPEVASWGRLLASIRVAPAAWWLLVWPGAAIFFTILSLHTLVSTKITGFDKHLDVTK